MRPDIPTVMNGLFATLLVDIAPNLNAEYSVGSAGLMGMSLFIVGAEFERGAEIRFRENEEMRALFAEAAGIVADKAFAARLLEASKGRDASLLISALEATNASLSTLLIELQVALEASSAAPAAALEAKVWDYLVTAAERRKLTLPTG